MCSVANLLPYIFSMQLQPSNGKHMFMQQETRPSVNSFQLGCCDQCGVITT